MIFNDDNKGPAPIRSAYNDKKMKAPSSMHSNAVNNKQNEKQKEYYQSQYHFAGGYDKEDEGANDELVIHAAEMHVQQVVDQSTYNKPKSNIGGFVSH